MKLMIKVSIHPENGFFMEIKQYIEVSAPVKLSLLEFTKLLI